MHAQYAEVPEEGREAWAKEQGAPNALSKIITTGFKAIHLIYFFTAGPDEVKCWQIRKATKAPQARTHARSAAARAARGWSLPVHAACQNQRMLTFVLPMCCLPAARRLPAPSTLTLSAASSALR